MDARVLLSMLLAAGPPSGGPYVVEPGAITAGRRLAAPPYELQAAILPVASAAANGPYALTSGVLAPLAGAPATDTLLTDGFEGASQ